jgi:hypothetical protein
VEQERDFLRKDLSSTRELMAKRDSEVAEIVRSNKEKEEKIKIQRQKKKALTKELNDMRSQVQALSN